MERSDCIVFLEMHYPNLVYIFDREDIFRIVKLTFIRILKTLPSKPPKMVFTFNRSKYPFNLH